MAASSFSMHTSRLIHGRSFSRLKISLKMENTFIRDVTSLFPVPKRGGSAAVMHELQEKSSIEISDVNT